MKRASLLRQAKPGISDHDDNNSKGQRSEEDAVVNHSLTMADIKTNESSNLKHKLNFKNLSQNVNSTKEPPRQKIKIPKGKVDMESMDNELKQLEDPPDSALQKKLSMNRLQFDFYNVECEELAKNLLGKVLVRQLVDGTILKGKIVETESYLGEIDAASHSYKNKVTPRNIPMFMLPGTIYVYMTYGMYYCFNISSGGKGAAVLLRALEPLEGVDRMRANRTLNRKSKNAAVKKPKELKLYELCNGPSKLCTAFQIDKDSCKYSLCTWRNMWIENANATNSCEEDIKIITTARIGIDSVGQEWASKPLRFYLYGNPSVSKRDKEAEKVIT